jgi:succinate dehydrogenase/fumarate reductase flavoprotein subunit
VTATGPNRRVDLVVLGGGAAGLSTAIEAADAGASVLLAEKTAELGGNCRYSGGNLLSLQGPAALRHLQTLCFGTTDDAVLRSYLQGLHQLPDWLISLGGSLHHVPHTGEGGQLSECWPYFPGAEGVRYYRVDGTPGESAGQALWHLLEGAVRDRTVDVRLSTRGVRLLQGPDGAVEGVELESSHGRFSAEAGSGVVLAVGGIENDRPSCDAYLPLASVVPISHLGNTGDGLRMAIAVGAALWHMSNFYGWLAFKAEEYSAAFSLSPAAPSYLLVDATGRRFCDETGSEVHDRIRPLLSIRPDRPNYPCLPAYLVFDEAVLDAGPLSRGSTPNSYRWSPDNRAEIHRGWISQGACLAGLCDKITCEAEVLAATLDRFNMAADAGHDDDFRRLPKTMAPLDTSRLYAVPLNPAVSTTCGGPRHDDSGRVLNSDGWPIEGLFAVGGTSAIWGYLTQHGGGLTDAMVFGRAAAQAALTGTGSAARLSRVAGRP